MNGSLLGKKIKYFRKRSGISRAEFAKAIGVENGTLGNFESGRIVPSLATYLKIQDILGLEPHDLLCGYVNADRWLLLQELAGLLGSLEPPKQQAMHRIIDIFLEERKRKGGTSHAEY